MKAGQRAELPSPLGPSPCHAVHAPCLLIAYHSLPSTLPPRSPPSPQGFRFVGIRAKLDYIAALGRGEEDVALAETARWWIHTFLRPDAHLVLGLLSSPPPLLHARSKEPADSRV